MNRLLIILFILTAPVVIHAQEITYEKDISPIVAIKCAPCHHPGGGAPFPLLTYQDVAKRVSFIKDVVETKYMPPWRADNDYVHFANDRSLSEKEIKLIIGWINNKSPQGTAVKINQSSTPLITDTKYGRKPDLLLKMTDSFVVKGNNEEQFIIFKIPFELKETANIEAIEFYSNNKKLIHHANYAVHEVADPSIDIYKSSPFVDLAANDKTNFNQYLPYRKSITYYGGWIPGTTYEYYPKEFGWVLPKRGVILLTVHFAPTPVDENSLSGVNLFFKKTPVTRPVKVISFGSGGIGEKDITPSFFIKPEQVKTFTLDLVNPGDDFSAMYVWPHMHYIGREFRAYAISPEGDTIRLVHIPEWDFRWQEIYRFKKLVKIPKGSRIHIEGTYDNTSQNPANPKSPPESVWSLGTMRSTDEMMTLMMVFLPYKEGDENISIQ